MNKKIKVEILKFNEPTLNKRIYSKKVIEEAIKEFKENDIRLKILNESSNEDFLNSIENTVGIVKKEDLILENDTLSLEIDDNSFLPTVSGEAIRKLFDLDKITFSPIGYGDVDGNGIISNYTLTGVGIYPKP